MLRETCWAGFHDSLFQAYCVALHVFPIVQVIGPGVVGYHPVLDPGEEFEYTSYTPLMSKRGTQRGTFSMLATQSKELFDVRVGPFALIPRP